MLRSRSVPSLIVFDLDACLWSPEMFELDRAPGAYDAKRGGCPAGHDTVQLFEGARQVLALLLRDKRFADTKVAAASSTTEPPYANHCLDTLRVDPERGEVAADVISLRQIYPGSKVNWGWIALLCSPCPAVGS